MQFKSTAAEATYERVSVALRDDLFRRMRDIVLRELDSIDADDLPEDAKRESITVVSAAVAKALVFLAAHSVATVLAAHVTDEKRDTVLAGYVQNFVKMIRGHLDDSQRVVAKLQQVAEKMPRGVKGQELLDAFLREEKEEEDSRGG